MQLLDTEVTTENYYHQLRDIESYLNYDVSEEGLKNLLVKLIDVFGQLTHVFKTNIFKSYRSLKRSEIRAYVESNILKLKIIQKAELSMIKDISIPAPNGMVSKYFKTAEDLNIAYNISDVLNIAQLMKTEVTQFYIAISDNKPSPDLKSTTRLVTSKGKQSKKVYDKLHTNFSDEHTKEFKFMEKFSSIRELIDTKNLLIDMEDRLLQVSKLNRILDDTDAVLSQILDVVKQPDNNVSKNDIQALATIVRSTAVMLEAYSTYAEIQMALEHNLTYVFDRIYKKIS